MPFVDEWGTTFRATCVRRLSETKQEPIDLTDSIVEFLFHKPSGAVVAVTAQLDRPKKGTAYYTVPEGFLDEVGAWRWQVRITSDARLLYGTLRDFVVASHLVET